MALVFFICFELILRCAGFFVCFPLFFCFFCLSKSVKKLECLRPRSCCSSFVSTSVINTAIVSDPFRVAFFCCFIVFVDCRDSLDFVSHTFSNVFQTMIYYTDGNVVAHIVFCRQYNLVNILCLFD